MRRALNITVLVPALLIGCASLTDLAPEVDEPALRYAAAHDIDAEQVHRGRLIYITECVRCHSPEPVTAYSLEHWLGILPRMADITALSPEDTEAVRAYVMVTLSAKSEATRSP
jgi:mono/diheme cytochrome c family protein